MVKGLIKGLAAGVAAAAGIVVVTSQFVEPIELQGNSSRLGSPEPVEPLATEPVGDTVAMTNGSEADSVAVPPEGPQDSTDAPGPGQVEDVIAAPSIDPAETGTADQHFQSTPAERDVSGQVEDAEGVATSGMADGAKTSNEGGERVRDTDTASSPETRNADSDRAAAELTDTSTDNSAEAEDASTDQAPEMQIAESDRAAAEFGETSSSGNDAAAEIQISRVQDPAADQRLDTEESLSGSPNASDDVAGDISEPAAVLVQEPEDTDQAEADDQPRLDNDAPEPMLDTAALVVPKDAVLPAFPEWEQAPTDVADRIETKPNAPSPDARPEPAEAPSTSAQIDLTELDPPTDDAIDLAALAPDLETPILPVPGSRRPTRPAPTDPYAQITPPTPLEDDVAESETDGAGREPGASFLSEDTGRNETLPMPDEGIDEDPVSSPSETGRETVRVGRLAQIRPPEEEAPADPTGEGGDVDIDATADETLSTDDGISGGFAEDPMVETEPSAEMPTRPSSNLIERRLQAIERARNTTGDGEDADLSSGATTGRGEDGGDFVTTLPGDAASMPSRSVEANPSGEFPEESAGAASTGVAFDDFSNTFDNPEGLPLVSVVLLDYGGPLIDIPLEISVALDAGQTDIAGRAALYRDRGYEVLVIPDLPRGGTPQDIEQALQVSLRAVEGAVAVIPDPATDLQGGRDATETLVGRLAETGHGFLSFPEGLNGAQQFATRAGVPAAVVFREIDGAGQDLRAVKRFIDQAAFRARQENAVILVGRNRPETRGALMEWQQSDRAETVRLAPVSAAVRELAP